MKIIELDEVDSTNEYCKRLETDEDVAVIAKRQISGKGTKGRVFISERGGVYLSVMRFYKDFICRDAFKIMVNSCVAVCKTLEAYSVKPNIRWANDVLVGGKKISGTLIENSFGKGGARSIVGIGLNVNNPIPDELKIQPQACRSIRLKKFPRRRSGLNLSEISARNIQYRNIKAILTFSGRR